MTDSHSFFDRLLADWDEAIVANDVDRIAAYAHPDWQFVSADGPSPGTGFLGAVRSGEVTHSAMRHELSSAVEVGDVAVVVARNINSGEYKGQAFENDEWTSDVFVRREERWLCLLTHLTAVRNG